MEKQKRRFERKFNFWCWLGWHKVTNIIGYDGCSNHGVCDRCGKECLQDSQGGWS